MGLPPAAAARARDRVGSPWCSGGRDDRQRRRGATRVLEPATPQLLLPARRHRARCARARAAGGSFCEFKGRARTTTRCAAAAGRAARRGVGSTTYRRRDSAPRRATSAFYAGRVDACFVDGEQVTPQPGGFYGGWITSTVAGPFKGGPGQQRLVAPVTTSRGGTCGGRRALAAGLARRAVRDLVRLVGDAPQRRRRSAGRASRTGRGRRTCRPAWARTSRPCAPARAPARQRGRAPRRAAAALLGPSDDSVA